MRRQRRPRRVRRVETGRRASFAESASFGLLSFGSTVILALATSVAIARLYGVEVVGAFALALAPSGILNGISSLREQTALVRDLATLEPRASRVTGLTVAVFSFSTALTLLMATITAAVVAVVMSGPVGRPDLVAPALALLATYIAFGNPNLTVEAVLLGFRAGRQLFAVRQLQAVVYLCLAVGAAFVADSVWGLVAATTLSTFIGLVARLRRVRPFLRLHVPLDEVREGFRALPGMIRYGVRLAPGSAADAISHEAGTVILGMTSPVAAVGAWSRAWMLSRRLSEPTHRVAEVLFPTLVERRANGDGEGFDLAAVDSARYSSLGLLLLASAGGGAAYGVMEVFGPGFTRAADALALLLLIPTLYCLTVIQAGLLAAVDRPTLASVFSIGRTIVIIAVAIGLSIPFGLTGVAGAYVIGYVIDVAARSTVTARHLNGGLRRLWPLRELVALPVAYGAGFAAARYVDDAVGAVSGTLLALTIGVLAFVVVYVVVGGLNARDRERVARLIERRRSRTRTPTDAAAGGGDERG